VDGGFVGLDDGVNAVPTLEGVVNRVAADIGVVLLGAAFGAAAEFGE